MPELYETLKPNTYGDCYECWFRFNKYCEHIWNSDGEIIDEDNLSDKDYQAYMRMSSDIKELNKRTDPAYLQWQIDYKVALENNIKAYARINIK
jgi:hypothetical protein